jgi:integrase
MADHIRKTESGWVADFRVAGKRRQLRAKTKAEAQERMAKELAELEQQPVRASAFTLEEARKLSLEVRWKGMACETTAAGYSADVVAFLGEDTTLASITAQEVERLRGYLRLKGNKAATINWKVSCLQSMLRDAQLYGYLDAVPVLPKRLRMDNRKDRVLSAAEVEAFCQAFRAYGRPVMADLFVFLVEVGCRWSEAEGMLERHVNLEQGTVAFLKTKTRKARTVPLTAKAREMVAQQLQGDPSRRVWPYTYKQYQYQFDKAKAALGLAGDLELTIHVTRHTLCSRLSQQGTALPQIMAWSGHKSLSAVERYLHLDVTGLEAARQSLEGLH